MELVEVVFQRKSYFLQIFVLVLLPTMGGSSRFVKLDAQIYQVYMWDVLENISPIQVWMFVFQTTKENMKRRLYFSTR